MRSWVCLWNIIWHHYLHTRCIKQTTCCAPILAVMSSSMMVLLRFCRINLYCLTDLWRVTSRLLQYNTIPLLPRCRHSGELNSIEEEQEKAPRQDVWPILDQLRQLFSLVAPFSCRDKITEERCEICLLTLLSPCLTLDYYDSCIFRCCGWHYFSYVSLRQFLLVPRYLTLTKAIWLNWSPKAFTRTRTEQCIR